MGLALAIAVLMDATVVRCLLVLGAHHSYASLGVGDANR